MKTRKTLLTTLVLSALMVPSLFAAETSALPVAPYNFITTTVTSNADGTLTATNKQGDVLREIKHIYLGDDGSTAARGKLYHTNIEPLYYRIFRYEDTVNKPKEHTLAELNDHYIKFESVDKDGKVSGSTVDLQGLNTGNATENAHYQYFGLDMTKDMADGTVSKAELTIDNGLYQGDLNELTGSRLTKDKLSIFKTEGEQQYDDEGNDITKKYVTDYDRHGVSIADENGNIRFTTTGINAGNQKIEGVAAGVADTDAVNVKQLNDKISALTDNDTVTTVTAGDNTTVTSTGHDYKVSVNKTLTDMNSATFGNGDARNVVDKTGVRVFNGSVNTGVTSNGMVIENTDTLEQASYTGSGMQASDDNATIRFTTTNIDAGNQIIHGVQAGVADTDAVNVKQLKDFMSSNDKDTITTVKAGNRIKVTNTGHDYTVALDDKTIDQINTTETGMKANARDIENLKVDVVKAKTTVTAGNGVVVNNTTNADGSTNYQVTVDKAVTDKVDANTKGIKDNADAIKANKDNIAINKAAIDELAAHIDNGGNNMNALNSKINDVQKESRQGIASASALAALHPLDYNPDHKVDVMAGLGHYRGKTAAAIGAAYRPNENVMFTIGTSINGKDTAINAGVSYKVGAKDSTYRSQAAMAKDIDDLKAMVNKLHEENSDLKAVIYNMQGK